MRVGACWLGVGAAVIWLAHCGSPYGTEGSADGGADGDSPETSPGDGSASGKTEADADAGTLTCTTDKDNDGHIARACGGDDCNDDDPLVHPGQAFVSEVPKSPNIGDWNCDGTVTKEHASGVSCQFFTCGQQKGFTGSPPCGTEGDYITCKLDGINCIVGTTVKQLQACK